MNDDVIIGLYDKIVLLLRIQSSPRLIINNNRSWYGAYYPDSNVIRISRYMHRVSRQYRRIDATIELIDTICHELAHVMYTGHDSKHTKLTKQYVNTVLDCTRLTVDVEVL